MKFRQRRMAVFAAVALAGALAADPSFGQEREVRFLGMPIEDWVTVVESVQSYVAGARALESFEESIGEARFDLFSVFEQPSKRPAAATRLAQLLQQKDYYYLRRAVLRTSQNRAGRDALSNSKIDAAAGKLLDLQLGPEIDGGIQPDAKSAFDQWTQGFITHVGDFATADEQRVAAALRKSRPLYEEYLRQRDKADLAGYQQWKSRGTGYADFKAKLDAAKHPDGGWRLDGESSRPFSAGMLAAAPSVSAGTREKVADLVKAAAARGQTVLQCRYGPSTMSERGASWELSGYQIFLAWHKQAPPEHAQIRALDDRLFRYRDGTILLGAPGGLDRCPDSSAVILDRVKQAAATYVAPTAAAPYWGTGVKPGGGPPVSRQPGPVTAAPMTREQRREAGRKHYCDGLAKSIARIRDIASKSPSPHMETSLKRVETNYAAQCGG